MLIYTTETLEAEIGGRAHHSVFHSLYYNEPVLLLPPPASTVWYPVSSSSSDPGGVVCVCSSRLLWRGSSQRDEGLEVCTLQGQRHDWGQCFISQHNLTIPNSVIKEPCRYHFTEVTVYYLWAMYSLLLPTGRLQICSSPMMIWLLLVILLLQYV